jgi:hypothetical protein
MPKSTETIQRRKEAIEYLNTHLPGAQVAFSHINKDDFLSQLRQRVEHPKFINQGATDFCGPAAALHALAQDDPVAFVKFALDLFVSGKATVRGWTVEAGNLTRETPNENMQIGECDWVMMASIRKNVNLGILTSVASVVGGMFPKEIEDSLKRLGYIKVVNKTSAIGSAGVDNLMEASTLWKQHYRVILAVNDEMFKNDKSILPIVKANHFCTLKSEVELKGDNFTCKLWQWGIDRKEPATADDFKRVVISKPKDEFLKHYFGYIAGTDSLRPGTI